VGHAADGAAGQIVDEVAAVLAEAVMKSELERIPLGVDHFCKFQGGGGFCGLSEPQELCASRVTLRQRHPGLFPLVRSAHERRRDDVGVVACDCTHRAPYGLRTVYMRLLSLAAIYIRWKMR
jgi:hypothetical protein